MAAYDDYQAAREKFRGGQLLGITSRGVDISDAEKLKAACRKLDAWDFNVLEVEKLTTGRPLFFVAHSLFEVMDVVGPLKINETKLRRLLNAVSCGIVQVKAVHCVINCVPAGLH